METKERVEEYNSIRQELLVYTNHIKDYRNIAYTVSVATLAFSFSDRAGNEPFVGLLPIMIIIPLFLACERSYMAISKMGSYIRWFYYEDGFHWENRGPHFHETLGHFKNGKKKNLLMQEVMFIDIIIISSMVTIYKVFISSASETEKYIRYIIVMVILLVAIKLIFDIRKFSYKQRKEYENAWKLIKETEKRIGKPLF